MTHDDDYQTEHVQPTVGDALIVETMTHAYPASPWVLITLTEKGTEAEPDMKLGCLMRRGLDLDAGLELAVMLLESQGFTVTEPGQ